MSFQGLYFIIVLLTCTGSETMANVGGEERRVVGWWGGVVGRWEGASVGILWTRQNILTVIFKS